MPVVGDILIWGVGVWLALTLAAQIDALARFINPFDPFHVIPRWTFFAPNPGVRDYHLVIRDREESGHLGPWRAVPLCKDRPKFAYLWNPQKRAKKILNDNVQAIKILIRRKDVGERGLPFSLPYLLVMNAAFREKPTFETASERQFAIVESSGHSERTLEGAFVSAFHPI